MIKRVIKSYEVTENKEKFFSMLKDINNLFTKYGIEDCVVTLLKDEMIQVLDVKRHLHVINLHDTIDIYDDKTFGIRGKESSDDEIMYPIKSIKLNTTPNIMYAYRLMNNILDDEPIKGENDGSFMEKIYNNKSFKLNINKFGFNLSKVVNIGDNTDVLFYEDGSMIILYRLNKPYESEKIAPHIYFDSKTVLILVVNLKKRKEKPTDEEIDSIINKEDLLVDINELTIYQHIIEPRVLVTDKLLLTNPIGENRINSYVNFIGNNKITVLDDLIILRQGRNVFSIYYSL